MNLKNISLLLLVSFTLLLTFSGTAQAASCTALHSDITDSSLVQCGQYPNCRCDLADFFVMILRAYKFAVYFIALPLAGLMIVLGGVLLMISLGGSTPLPGGGSSGLATRARKILTYSIVALLLIVGSYFIIDVVLKAIGYNLQWNRF